MRSCGARLHGCARVLLLIDQRVLAEGIKVALGHGPYVAQVARTVEDAAAALAAWRPHLTIIDLDMGGSAILDQLARAAPQLRDTLRDTPIVGLTRRGDLKTRLAAFERGVDDLLVVPFSPEELVARIGALMRRSYRETPAFAPPLRVGELEVDLLNRHVRAGGVELRLTPLELSLLYLLAANAGRLVTREEILDQIWGADYVAGSNVIDRHIHELRAKLQRDSWRPRCIVTVPGRGYRFVPATGAEAPSPRPASGQPKATVLRRSLLNASGRDAGQFIPGASADFRRASADSMT